MEIYYRGAFGRRAADLAATMCTNPRIIEYTNDTSNSFISPELDKRAVVFFSDASGTGLDRLAVHFQAAGISWTAVHLYPSMLRIGPIVRDRGVCFFCATRRYLSAPGSLGLARLEEILRSVKDHSLEFSIVPPTIVTMAVAEAFRQLEDETVPSGFICKYDFIEHSMTAAVAPPLHGCACGEPTERLEPGARFYANLEREIVGVIREESR